MQPLAASCLVTYDVRSSVPSSYGYETLCHRHLNTLHRRYQHTGAGFRPICCCSKKMDDELVAQRRALQAALGTHSWCLSEEQYNKLVAAGFVDREALLDADETSLREILQPKLAAVSVILAWQKDNKEAPSQQVLPAQLPAQGVAAAPQPAALPAKGVAQLPPRGEQKSSGRSKGPVPAAATTVKLSNSAVLTMDVFPNTRKEWRDITRRSGIIGITNDCNPTLPAMTHSIPQALEDYIIKFVLDPVFTYGPIIRYGVEEPALHSMRLVLLNFAKVCGAAWQMYGTALSDGITMEQRGSTWSFAEGVWQKAMEKTMHLQGRIEMQCMRVVGGVSYFEGAVLVGKELYKQNLVHIIEHAKKEALCMWLANAIRGQYHKVWVLLTDGVSIMRIEYEGFNQPGSGKPEAREKMHGKDVYGVFRCTHGAQMWATPESTTTVVSSISAMQIIMGAFLQQFGDQPPTVQMLDAFIKEEKAKPDRMRDDWLQVARAYHMAGVAPGPLRHSDGLAGHKRQRDAA